MASRDANVDTLSSKPEGGYSQRCGPKRRSYSWYALKPPLTHSALGRGSPAASAAEAHPSRRGPTASVAPPSMISHLSTDLSQEAQTFSRNFVVLCICRPTKAARHRACWLLKLSSEAGLCYHQSGGISMPGAPNLAPCAACRKSNTLEQLKP